MTIASPRAYLAEHWPNVKIYLRVLPGGHWGRTVWTDDGPEIYLRADLGRIARRVTLAHEIGHLELGPPEPGDEDDNERDAVAWAARFLLPDIAALGRVLAPHDVGEAARRLMVTKTVLLDRLDLMGDDERARLSMVLAKAGVAA